MRHVLPLVLLASFALTACDSGGGGDSAAVAGELAVANSKISAAVTAGISSGGVRSAMPACPGGGTVDVVEFGDDGFRMTFANCNDVSGTFDVRALTGGSSDARLRFDGDLSVRNSCDVSYDAYEIGTSFASGGDVTLTFNGGIEASCPSGTTRCSFSNASFTVSQSGTPAPDFTPYCN